MRSASFGLVYRQDEVSNAPSSFISQRVGSALVVHQQVKKDMLCHRTVQIHHASQVFLNDLSAGAVDWTFRSADSRSRDR